jgi:hypothetical protein
VLACPGVVVPGGSGAPIFLVGPNFFLKKKTDVECHVMV